MFVLASDRAFSGFFSHSAALTRHAQEIRLGVRNFSAIKATPAAEYAVIRADCNNNCNIRCVYCHSPRSDELIQVEDFARFLDENVVSVDYFQFGCVMEPTLDPRLCELMAIVGASRARPKRAFRLQTNGILLHRHDHRKMLDAGLTILTVSVDSVSAETQKSLRGGTSLEKVQRNIREFHETCPTVRIVILTTVTGENIHEIEDLVAWGLAAGVGAFELRQVYYLPDSKVVDHERMPSLVVSAEAFAGMQDRITARFADAARLHFQSSDAIVKRARAMREQSLLA